MFCLCYLVGDGANADVGNQMEPQHVVAHAVLSFPRKERANSYYNTANTTLMSKTKQANKRCDRQNVPNTLANSRLVRVT